MASSQLFPEIPPLRRQGYSTSWRVCLGCWGGFPAVIVWKATWSSLSWKSMKVSRTTNYRLFKPDPFLLVRWKWSLPSSTAGHGPSPKRPTCNVLIVTRYGIETWMRAGTFSLISEILVSSCKVCNRGGSDPWFLDPRRKERSTKSKSKITEGLNSLLT